MLTRKDWQTFKKRHEIPDGAVKGVAFGPELDKVAAIVDGKKKGDALKAIHAFRKVHKKYVDGLKKDKAAWGKAKAFLDDVEKDLDAAEKTVFAAVKSAKKGAVINLDPGDKVIDPSSEDIAKNRKHGADSALRRRGESDDEGDARGHGKVLKKGKDTIDLSEVDDEPIVILAHGTPLGKVGQGKRRASHFANKKPKEIVDHLVKKWKLPTHFSGIVYLDGCYTAAGNTPQNFAKQVYDGLVAKGYPYLQVKGNLGAAITFNGKEFVIPAELDDEYERLKKRKAALDKEIDKIEKPYDARIRASVDDIKNFLAGRRAAQLEGDDKAEYERLRKISEGLAPERDEKSKALRAERKQIQETLEGPQMKIEALVGTFGPERLRPRR